jgi:hypothetical protein
MFLEAGKADNFADVVRSGEIMNALQAILAEIPIEINSDPLLMAERSRSERVVRERARTTVNRRLDAGVGIDGSE